MMKIEIDTETGKIIVDGKEIIVKKEEKKSLVNAFMKYLGVKEYNGAVSNIQKWYYGRLVKASWCATAVSYFANQLGLLDKIGGKNENVYRMMKACEALDGKTGTFFNKNTIPATILENDICFFLWSGNTMKTTSSKHVAIAYESTLDKKIACIGGNQDDSISIKDYDKKYLYGVFRLYDC